METEKDLGLRRRALDHAIEFAREARGHEKSLPHQGAMLAGRAAEAAERLMQLLAGRIPPTTQDRHD